MTKTITDSKKIVKKLIEAKKAYYDGNPVMSDADFDALEDELRAIDSDNDYFGIVGASLGNIKEKVAHKFPMLSCAKAKTFEDVKKWSERIDVDSEVFIVTSKIDGMSGSCIYEDGKLVMICTRGDGKVGQNISHLSRYINVPQTIDIKERVEIRGEIYLPKNTNAPNPENKPLRNMCVGMVGRKNSKLEDLRYIHFVTYQVIGSKFNLESEKMLWLKKSFETVEYRLLNLNELEAYREEYVSKLRDAWNYESDGLVVCVNNNTFWDNINSKYEVSHHWHHNLAWKPESESAETVLEGIEWQVSRSGKLIPVAIVKPVVLGKREVQRATLNNYENVVKLKLHKGDRVIIQLANDVVPFFSENLTKH